MLRKGEVDLLDAMDMLDQPEEVLGKLTEEGRVKSRRCEGTIYFLREETEKIIDREIDTARSETPADAGGGSRGPKNEGLPSPKFVPHDMDRA